VPGYEVLEELGRGAVGVVYKARQLALHRVVALKTVRQEAAPQELARFRVEAEAVARLQHPNIVQIYEVGEFSGAPFLALEYCAGGSLAAQLNGAPICPKDAAVLARTLAEAIEAAHRVGVVHRDLKPGNILIALNQSPTPGLLPAGRSAAGPERRWPLASGFWVAKIADFGIAKRLAEPAPPGAGATGGRVPEAPEVGHTATGSILGTPSYMAPEQASGRAKEVGPAADVYAVGAILYELLTGRAPFRGRSVSDTLRQVISRDPVPPRQLNRSVPRDLEAICLVCLRKEPDRRYASARSLADDLARFLEHAPTLARPVGLPGFLWGWCRRRPAAAGLVGVVALFLLTVLVLAPAAAWSFARAARLESQHAEDERLAKEQAQIGQRRAEEEATRLRTARQEAERLVNEGELRKRLGLTGKARELWGPRVPLDPKAIGIQAALVEAVLDQKIYGGGGELTDVPAAEFISRLAEEHPDLKGVAYAAALAYLRLAAEAQADRKVPERPTGSRSATGPGRGSPCRAFA
jgi:hypothetical protein